MTTQTYKPSWMSEPAPDLVSIDQIMAEDVPWRVRLHGLDDVIYVRVAVEAKRPSADPFAATASLGSIAVNGLEC